MTQQIQQIIQQNNMHGHGYETMNRNNYDKFLSSYEPGPANIAHDIVDQTLNKPSLIQLVKNGIRDRYKDTDPTSCFVVEQKIVNPVIKSVAAIAIEEYGLSRVGYIDMNVSVSSLQRAENTLRKVQQVGKVPAGEEHSITFIAVKAGHGLNQAETEAANEIYGTLSRLTPENFRVAILGSTEQQTS